MGHLKGQQSKYKHKTKNIEDGPVYLFRYFPKQTRHSLKKIMFLLFYKKNKTMTGRGILSKIQDGTRNMDVLKGNNSNKTSQN